MILVVVVVGLVLLLTWALFTYVPVPPVPKAIIGCVVVLLLLVWALSRLGVIGHIG